MDIWASYATRRSPCYSCTTGLLPGDRVIIGQSKRTHPWGTRTHRQMSHLDCWVVQANLHLDDNPYEPVMPVSPGRPRKYTPTQAKRRAYLHMTMYKWGKQQHEYLSQGMWAMADRYRDKIVQARGELDNMLLQ